MKSELRVYMYQKKKEPKIDREAIKPTSKILFEHGNGFNVKSEEFICLVTLFEDDFCALKSKYSN